MKNWCHSFHFAIHLDLHCTNSHTSGSRLSCGRGILNNSHFRSSLFSLDIHSYCTKFLWHTLTILYWTSSIVARLDNRSNIDTPRPKFFATLSWMTGCSCLWSPIRTICLAREPVIGITTSGSVLMPHSSTMHCLMLSHDLSILGLPDTTHVQSIIWTAVLWMAHVSAVAIN